MKFKQILTLILCIAIPQVVGGIAGYFTVQEIDGWYSTLIKPSFNPPNSIFGPVWTSLYLLMGISLYIIWKSPESEHRKKALQLFTIQLILNFSWSIVFFSFHLLFTAIVVILLLWVFIFIMIKQFKKIKSTAAYINIPYLLWVSFATVLNISLWWLNK